MSRLYGVVLCLLLVLSAPWVHAAGPTATLSIGNAEAQPGDTVSVPVALATNGTQPGLIIFRVTYEPSLLTYVATEPGAATLAAGKEIDATLASPGVLNIVILGFTFDAIHDGVLAELSFTLADTFTSGQTALLGSNNSISSPFGSSVSSMIVSGSVGIPCATVGDPQNVTASTGRTDGILVQWAAAQDATEYQVYRAATNNSATAEPVSGWTASLQYLDTTAASSQASSGCAPGQTNRVYYYWVRARNDAECGGALAGGVQGSRAASKTADAGAYLLISMALITALGASRARRTLVR